MREGWQPQRDGHDDAPEVLHRGSLQRLDPLRLQLISGSQEHKLFLAAVVTGRETCSGTEGRARTRTHKRRYSVPKADAKFG